MLHYHYLNGNVPRICYVSGMHTIFNIQETYFVFVSAVLGEGLLCQVFQKKIEFFYQNYRMACKFILVRGKNKGKQCNLKGINFFSGQMYCSRHYKMQEISMMKQEDLNCNAVDNSSENDASFQIIKEIGNGAFGRVMLIQDTETKECYAMKTTQNIAKQEADLLFYEYTLLSQHFVGSNHFPRLLPRISRSYTRTESETCLILEYFEETLSQRRRRYTLSNEEIKSYGLQMLTIIEYIHSLHFLYIDIKPENFMFKTDEDTNIKIIDFGLCQKYLDYRGKHIQSKILSNPIGTDLYASIRMLSCNQPGRMDDIECIGYLLLYLYHGSLPWSNSSSSNEVLLMKTNGTVFPNTPEYIWKFVQSSQAVDSFDVKPDYNLFRALLSE